MTRIYEVKTEYRDGKQAYTYRVAAKQFTEAVAKVQKKEIDPFLSESYVERISECRILASEG